MFVGQRRSFGQKPFKVMFGAFCGIFLLGELALADISLHLRILATSDIHAHIYNYDYYTDTFVDDYGLTKTAQLIAQSRAEVKNSILIDDGDLLQGTPVIEAYIEQRKSRPEMINPVIDACNLMNYDVMNLGNHEFNYGMDYLRESIRQATFPVISANVYQTQKIGEKTIKKNAFNPYVILRKTMTSEDGRNVVLHIAVIGVLPPQIMNWDRQNLADGYETADMVESVRHFLPEVKAEHADLVIVAAHSGLGEETPVPKAENAGYALSKIDGVDILIGGHVHKNFPVVSAKDPRPPLPDVDFDRGLVSGKPMVIPGFWGDHVGMIDIALHGEPGHWTVTERSAKLLSAATDIRGKAAKGGLVGDDRIIKMTRKIHESTIAYLKKPVGKLTTPMNSYFALLPDDAAIALVTEAQKWFVKRDLAHTTYKGMPLLSVASPFRGPGAFNPLDIPKGPISLRDIANLYVYRNTLVVVALSGANLKKWLEMASGAFNTIDPQKTAPQALFNPAFIPYNFDVIDGVTYRIDVRQKPHFDENGKEINPDAYRISDVRYEGRLVGDGDKFLVVTNNHRADGDFPGVAGGEIVKAYAEENRSAIIAFIENQKTVEVASHPWGFLPFTAKGAVVFESNTKGRSFADHIPGLSWQKDQTSGLSAYQIDFTKQ